MRTQPFLAAALLLAVPLAGCGGWVKPDPAPSPAKFDTPQAVVAAMEQKGIACTGYDTTEGAIGAVGRGSCYIDGEEVLVSVYATKADAENEPQRKHQLLAGVSEVIVVVGENWTASCDLVSHCERIAAGVGGRLVRVPA